MNRKGLSLRKLLIFSFILIGGLPVVILGFIAVKLVSVDIAAEAHSKNLLIAQSVASEVDVFLDSSFSRLAQINYSGRGKGHVARDEIHAYFDHTLKPRFQSVEILDAKGVVQFVSPVNPDIIGINRSGQRFFSHVTEKREPFWSSTFVSLQTGKPTVTLAIPTKEGMVVGYLNLASLNDVTDRIKVGKHGYALVADQSGTVIAHPDRSRVSERQDVKHIGAIGQGKNNTGGSTTRSEDGTEYLVSTSPVTRTHWTVVIAVPTDEAFDLATRVRMIFGIGAFFVVFFAAAAALVSLRRITHPLSDIVDDTRKIAEGRYALAKTPSGYQEIDALMRNIHAMAEGIKGREEELKRSKDTLQAFFDAVSESMVLVDAEGRVFLTNTTHAERLGTTVDDMIGKPLYDYYFPEDIGAARKEQFRKVLSTGRPVYFQDTRAGRFFEHHYYPFFHDGEKAVGVAVFAQDITEQKVAERKVRESEQRFRALVETTSDWVWEVDANGLYTYVSPKVKDLLGYTPAEVIGKGPFDFMPPEEMEGAQQIFMEAVRNRVPLSGFENVNLHKDGRRVILETNGVPTFDATGNFTGYRGIDRDITTRKQEQADLLFTRSVMDRMMGMVFWSMSDGQLAYVNESACNRLGYSRDELLRLRATDLIPGYTVAKWAAFWDELAQKKSVILEGRYRKKNGEVFPTEVRADLISFGGLDYACGIVYDITERKQVEEEHEGLIAELQQALSKVKTLSGLLPICASCKKIRDDKGYWNQIESFISEHSEAEFSHGICPECAAKLYPEYVKKPGTKEKPG
jgi:PAS domain S-box-containing protein